MTLAELKEKDPQAYAQLQKEAITLAEASLKEAHEKAVQESAATIATLTQERDTLKAKADAFEIKEKAAAHKAAVAKLVTESQLDPKFVSATFLSVLESQESLDRVKELIDDRKQMLADIPSGTTTHTEESTTQKTKEGVNFEALGAEIAREVARRK